MSSNKIWNQAQKEKYGIVDEESVEGCSVGVKTDSCAGQVFDLHGVDGEHDRHDCGECDGNPCWELLVDELLLTRDHFA